MPTTLAQLAALFTAPALAAGGVVCVAIPVAIHLLSRTRRTRAEWGAMRFLRLAFKKQKRKLRMEKWLLLLTRCAIMVIAGLALAGPLLSGVWGGLTPGSAGGRTVHLVLENGLSTRAAVGEGNRFEALRTTALELVEGLSPNDAVQLWTTTPGSSAANGNKYFHPATPTPTLDHGQVQRILEDLEPGYGRSELAGVLQKISDQIEAEGSATARPPVVAVLSDFARGAADLEQNLPAELSTLGERATVVVTRPDVGSGNLQIQTLRPRRSLVLTGSPAPGRQGNNAASATVSVEVIVRRFDDTTAAATGQLDLSLTPPSGETLPAVTRPVTWSAGQSTATLSVDLPISSAANLDGSNASGISGASGWGDWIVTAMLAGDAGIANAVQEDDRRLAVVEVRPRLRVGVIADESAGIDSGGGLNPAAFVRAALSPEQTGERFAVTTDTLLPATVAAARLADFDAMMVLRPELLGPAEWSALAEFAAAGGLVWVAPPANPDPAVQDWFSLMRSALGVDWELDEDVPLLVPDPNLPLRLDTDARPPAALLLLSADWSALLDPLRIERTLSVTTPEPSQTWMTLARPFNEFNQGGRPSLDQQKAFLAAAPVGEGQLLWLSVAIDPAWTNLPTKPVFPALLHDALRGVLGGISSDADLVVGDTVALGRAWGEVVRLQQLGGDAGVLLSNGQPAAPLAQPGVYGPSAGDDAITAGGRLAVNVPAEAGDVRAVREAQLAAWLDDLGAWDYLNADEPAAVLVTAERRSNLGWALLWVLLVLVVAEMFMARWFSHAEAPRRGSASEAESGRTKKIRKRFSPFSRAAGFLLFLVFGLLGYLIIVSPSAEASVWDDLLGLSEVSFAEATAIGWRFAWPAWAWVLIVGASLAAAWWSYRRLLGPTWTRLGLAGLRGLLLVLIAVLLAGPEVVRTDETVEEDVLLVLVDRSASMTVADTLSSGSEANSETPALISREAALRAALENQGQVFGDEQLGRGRQIAWLGFGGQAFEIASPVGDGGVAALGEPGDQTTALRTALEAALRRGAGRPISGVVLMSDGRSPEATGDDLLAQLEQQSVRIYSVPLGAERLPLDLALSRVEAPTTAFINDTVPVTVVVDQSGRASADVADDSRVDPSRVTVRLIDTETQDILDEKTLEGVGLGQPLRLEGRSSQTGEMLWGVEVVYDSPAAGERELNLTNNVESFTVDLIDRAIRVLYVEGYPRWEYRYLKNMLIREPSIDSSILLLSADRAFAQEGDTPITRLPSEPAEWQRYDVVIIGDVPAEAMSAEQRKQLHDQVSQRGAGVLWLAGPGNMPSSYAATMLADLLPMRDPEAVSLLPWARASVEPTALAESLSVLQLRAVDASEDDAVTWPKQLPSLRWVQNMGPLKPSAEVLAEVYPTPSLGNQPGADGDGGGAGIFGSDTVTDEEKEALPPLITRLRFGAGQSLYVATDETWRWRYARGEVYFEQFWVQLVRMLGRAAATRSEAPVRLAVSTRSTPVGGTVVLDLDMDDAALIARDLPSIKVAVRRAGDALERDVAEFELRPIASAEATVDNTSRRYSAAWLANLPGELELVVTDPALSGLDLRAALDVIASDDELRRAEADVPRLMRLAEATGGRVVPLNDLQQLAQTGVIRNLSRKTANDIVEPIWNSALALLLVVGLIALEWIGRKLVRLV